MELVRILAKDSKSATEEVLKKYGEDALVISNQKLNGKTELIVAVDIDSGPDLDIKTSGVSGETPTTSFPDIFETRLMDGRSKTTEKNENPSPPKQTNDRDSLRARELVELVREELTSIKNEINMARKSGVWQTQIRTNSTIEPFIRAMENTTMPTSLRILLTEHVSGEKSISTAKDKICNWLKENIRKEHPSLPASGIQVISGPSGSGKSTIANKLASVALEKYGPDTVAVISFNDKRLGAWGQTQVLASRSGVEAFRCKTIENLGNLLEELSDRKLVVIDTPGVGIEENLQILKKRLGNSAQYRLALPANSSLASLNKNILHSDNDWDSLFLSKMDESEELWPVVWALTENDIGISGLTRSTGADIRFDVFDATDFINSSIESIKLSDTIGEDPRSSEGDFKTEPKDSLDRYNSTMDHLELNQIKDHRLAS